MHNSTQVHRPEVMIKGQGTNVPLANTSESCCEYSRTQGIGEGTGDVARPTVREAEICRQQLSKEALNKSEFPKAQLLSA